MNTTSIGLRRIDPRLKVYIAESISEVLADPDFGLELSATAKRRLKQARAISAKGISLAALMKRCS